MDFNTIIQECDFKAVRSSGAGGQHVNKVSSKIELSFSLINSNGLTENEKNRLLEKIANKISKDSVLVLTCSESRSQHKNKELVVKKLLTILKNGLVISKTRLKTKIPKSVIRKRLKTKKRISEKKVNRKRPPID